MALLSTMNVIGTIRLYNNNNNRSAADCGGDGFDDRNRHDDVFFGVGVVDRVFSETVESLGFRRTNDDDGGSGSDSNNNNKNGGSDNDNDNNGKSDAGGGDRFVDVRKTISDPGDGGGQRPLIYRRGGGGDVGERGGGEIDEDDDVAFLHVVLSHCDKPIRWVWNSYLRDLHSWTTNTKTTTNAIANSTRTRTRRYSVKSVTIFTKCGYPLTRTELPTFEAHAEEDENDANDGGKGKSPSPPPPPPVSVLSLPNAGGNDHSFAYWIQAILNADEDRADDGDDNGDGDYSSSSTKKKKKNPMITEHKVLYRSDHEDDDHHHHHLDPLRKIAAGIDKRDLVLFLKDNDNRHRNWDVGVPLRVMLEDALSVNRDRTDGGADETTTTIAAVARKLVPGVACGRTQTEKPPLSMWAHRSLAWRWEAGFYKESVYDNNNNNNRFRSRHRPMGAWIRSLASSYDFPDFSDPGYYEEGGGGGGVVEQPPPSGASDGGGDDPAVFSDAYLAEAIRSFDEKNDAATVPTDVAGTVGYTVADLVPVCYGGVFVALWGQLSSEDAAVTPHGWKVIAHALSRTNNLEEGHYAERWWAELLGWSSYASSSSSSSERSPGAFLTPGEENLLLKKKRFSWPADHMFPGSLMM